MNSRSYVQRERARKTARTATAIENAALREVARRGYPDLRVSNVAKRAHVSPRTVYLHASSKERLVEQALRRRASALISRVERWRPRGDTPQQILDEMVALHEREYRGESALLLETLVDGALPRAVAALLRDLDVVRLAVITRTMNDLAHQGALGIRTQDAVALAHALLSYPTWRTALTGPARRRAPRLVAAALRSAVL
ncbi:MAG TPA: TetR/AcrR family transcriptional regulator [Candidatus Limnocylindrales bacterium]|nr:TetR/AcrR family transcriptional regulator [Candidatus Limnocylindrales bacterium]